MRKPRFRRQESRMSADNGVYVLRTRRPDGTLEYRVAHRQNIENIYWDEKSERYGAQLNPEWTRKFFGGSEVFTDLAKVFQAAGNLLMEQMEDFGYVEYGLKLLDHSEQVFPA
ncbi:MAG: hypothetical protein WAW60_03545 [Candidatus Saccharimonadales bacterium]